MNTKSQIKKGFSKRLSQKMIECHLVNNKSQTSPNAKKLAEISNCSLQMAYKYLNGTSLPEQSSLEKISKHLNADPWWLLYGEKDKNNSKTKDDVIELLETLLLLSKKFIKNNEKHDIYVKKISYIIEVFDNIYELNGDKSARKKAIELMMGSNQFFE
jgi:transcriptional regulator with XRE-family HTH domain